MKIDGMWGHQVIVDGLRYIFMYQTIPEDVTQDQVLWWIDRIFDYKKYYRGMEKAEPFYRPTSVQFLGPGMASDGFDLKRITMSYGPDRRISFIGVG
jgi:hypothetical protein